MKVLFKLLILIYIGEALSAQDIKVNVSIASLPTDEKHSSYGYVALGYNSKIEKIKNLRTGIELSHYRYKDNSNNYYTDRVNTVFTLEYSLLNTFITEFGFGLSQLQAKNDTVAHFKFYYLYEGTGFIGLKSERYFNEQESIYSTFIGIRF